MPEEGREETSARRLAALERELAALRTELQSREALIGNLRVFALGLSHDLNNLIGGILGHAGMIRGEARPGSDIEVEADVIIRAAERAAELAAQLRHRFYPAPVQEAPVDVHDTIREVVSFLRGSTPPAIRFELRLDAPAAVIMGDASQIHQMLLNLALNARDAIGGAGEIVLATRLRDDATLEVSVRDTGCGIAEKDRERIFEPAFTTKPAGTGWGLAIAKQVIASHGGSLELDSAPGAGSTFRITLPLAAREAAAAAN